MLTDQNMPRLDGLGLIRSLRSLPDRERTPILVLSTEASQDMKMKGKAAGATRWMVKRFDPEKPIEVVRKVIG